MKESKHISILKFALCFDATFVLLKTRRDGVDGNINNQRPT